MRLPIAACSILLAAFALTGCFYDTSGDPDDAGTDTDTGPDTSFDSGISGMGATCNGDEDCEDYEASLCVQNPTSPSDPGFCSLDGCGLGDCPANFPQCCDCSSLDWVVTCLDDATAGMVSGYCTCE